MNTDMSLWKFTVKRHGYKEMYFGVVYAYTEKEARENIALIAFNPEERKLMNIVSLEQVSDNSLLTIIGGYEPDDGLNKLDDIVNTNLVSPKPKPVWKFKVHVGTTKETFYGVTQACNKQEVVDNVLKAVLNKDRSRLRITGIDEVFTKYPTALIGYDNRG